MTIDAARDSALGGAGQPGYARFLPRLRALYIDSIILIVAGFGILSVAVMLRSDNIARVLGFAIVASWLLYEPLLVSFAGGTIGHRRTNLCVVDDRTQGNVGLLKSFARSIIKAALGGVSFITMLTTRRSQAIHDLLTRSTVQVRDLALAGPQLYLHDQSNLADPALPSRMRRVLVIVAYIIASAVLFFALLFFLFRTGLMSQRCLGTNRCSLREDLSGYTLVIGWWVACLCWLWFGWRGRLLGCRAARV